MVKDFSRRHAPRDPLHGPIASHVGLPGRGAVGARRLAAKPESERSDSSPRVRSARSLPSETATQVHAAMVVVGIGITCGGSGTSTSGASFPGVRSRRRGPAGPRAIGLTRTSLSNHEGHEEHEIRSFASFADFVVKDFSRRHAPARSIAWTHCIARGPAGPRRRRSTLTPRSWKASERFIAASSFRTIRVVGMSNGDACRDGCRWNQH